MYYVLEIHTNHAGTCPVQIAGVGSSIDHAKLQAVRGYNDAVEAHLSTFAEFVHLSKENDIEICIVSAENLRPYNS